MIGCSLTVSKGIVGYVFQNGKLVSNALSDSHSQGVDISIPECGSVCVFDAEWKVKIEF